jgi:nitrogen-specific signal transduction histidine kinase
MLGGFSGQMAHDLKNPLAALKGAAQLLREDLTRPSPGIDRVQFADLMLEQIERLVGLVDAYVDEVVEAHEGHASLSSEPGRGTVVVTCPPSERSAEK